jgi:hypothetical protein
LVLSLDLASILSGLRGITVNAQDHVESARQIRPWVRLWARYIDLCLAGSVCGLIWETIGPPVNTKYVVTCILYALLWVPIEAILLSTWGTTPGKWLLRTTLIDSTGNKLKFSAALSRSLYVWAWGLGIGFPYATLVAELFAYLDLQNKGVTRWDREGGFRISHGIIGTHRGVVTIILFICLTVMLGFSADLIRTPSSGPSKMAIVVGIGILLVISLASLVSLKVEDAEQGSE